MSERKMKPSTAALPTVDIRPPQGRAVEANAGSDEAPPFATISVARSNTARPSELEVYLRSHCLKMKVSTHLSGAHVILRSQTSSSIAVRCYYHFDLEKLEKKRRPQQERQPQQQVSEQTNRNKNNSTLENDAEDDGLAEFVRRFQWTVVFFIVPTAEQQSELLCDQDSFPRRTMHLLLDITNRERHHASNNNNKSSPAAKLPDNPPRIMFLQSTQQAIQYLKDMMEAIKPAKHAMRNGFFQQRQRLNVCDSINTNSDPEAQRQQHQQQNAAAATRAVAVVRQLADRLGLPPGEVDLIWRVLEQMNGAGTTKLSTFINVLTAANGEPDGDVLQKVPIDHSSKVILQRFFQGDGSTAVGISTATIHYDDPNMVGGQEYATATTRNYYEPPPFPGQQHGNVPPFHHEPSLIGATPGDFYGGTLQQQELPTRLPSHNHNYDEPSVLGNQGMMMMQQQPLDGNFGNRPYHEHGAPCYTASNSMYEYASATPQPVGWDQPAYSTGAGTQQQTAGLTRPPNHMMSSQGFAAYHQQQQQQQQQLYQQQYHPQHSSSTTGWGSAAQQQANMPPHHYGGSGASASMNHHPTTRSYYNSNHQHM